MKPLLFLLLLSFPALSQVSQNRRLTPPLGLKFGITQGQADKIMSERGGILNVRSSVSGARVYKNVEIGNYYFDTVLFFKGTKFIGIEAKNSDGLVGRRIYEDIRISLIQKYGVPSKENRFDEATYLADSFWLFQNGGIHMTVSKLELILRYLDHDITANEFEKGRNSF